MAEKCDLPWQEVMENIVAKKTDETRRRWDAAIKDKNFDCLRNLTRGIAGRRGVERMSRRP